MIVNNSSAAGNDTITHVGPSSPPGLIVGLTLFFLLLVIGAGGILYKYHSSIRNMLQFGHRRSQKDNDGAETSQAESHRYTSMITQQTDRTGQTPIYENLTTQTGYNRLAVGQSRSPGEPEENLYLQCDLPDDEAIYSNDPACKLSIFPDFHEEDVYIVPDS